MNSTPSTFPDRRPLESFFAPGSIALIGASERVGSVGRALMENLRGYGRPVYPVNPRRSTVLGQPAFASLSALPSTPDLAVIATPAATLPQILEECGRAGIKSAIVISAGFRECGPAGAELERRTARVAADHQIRVLGPNCLGLLSPHTGLNASFAATLPKPGSVAFLSQSGALCTAVLDWSLQENVGFSAFVSVGAMMDLGWGDLITFLGDDPHTHSILLYMESIGCARSFLSAAREVSFEKPIIVVKAGRSAAAARAAASHTGALAGSDRVVEAALRRAGVLRVETIEELFDMAETLAKQPRPRGPRLGIVTNAGGPAALAVDRLIASGGEVAKLEDSTVAALDACLPPQWSRANPVDILGDADAARYAAAVQSVASDPNVDGLLVVLTPQAMTDPLSIAAKVAEAAVHAKGKPILTSWMGAGAVEAGERLLNQANIPTFKYPDRAARAFGYLWQHSRNLEALYETPEVVEAPASGKAAEILGAVRTAGRTLLTEVESKAVLSAYDVPLNETVRADSESDAVAAAVRLGFPVALKVLSETITHKSDVGGVKLNLHGVAQVREAWRAIRRGAIEHAGEPSFLGVSVQAMVACDGRELIVGSSVDPQFGPVLLFGAGGRWAEQLQDRAIGLPPLTSTLARRLMEETKIYSALKASRGGPTVDLAALEQILVRLSQLVSENRWIKEIDINPLCVSEDRILAVDARIILHDATTSERNLPPLAIRPYPAHYATQVALKDGTNLFLRSIRPDDERLMIRFHEALSDQSVYFRYFTALTLQQRTQHRRLARVCFIDHDREVALVAERRDEPSGTTEILGVARLCRKRDIREAEFAVVVADAWQGHGLGKSLMTRLIDIAREEGFDRLTGVVLADNHAMRGLCTRLGFELHRSDTSEYEATLNLTPAAHPASARTLAQAVA